MKSRRQEVTDEIEAIFKSGNLVHRVRTFEYLLSGLAPPPSPLQWINPSTLASLSSQESEGPDYYSISVKYSDGRVTTESYYREEGPKPKEIVLTVDEAKYMLQQCLAAIMQEISETKVV